MEEIIVPLISPLSRKYYDYATEKHLRKHYRAEDVRICLEYICDHMIVIFVSEKDKEKWKNYDLYKKINSSKYFLDTEVVNKLSLARIVGNEGVHNGEEGKYTEADIEISLDAIRNFSLEIFYAYFKKYGFECVNKPWVPTIFSVLPPIYRIKILEKYYCNCEKSEFVIDKLSKVYLKGGYEDKARSFLKKCYQNKEIDSDYYAMLNEDVTLLKSCINVLPIAENLEVAKEHFNNCLSIIEENERDSFICLMSMILIGKNIEKEEKNGKYGK